MYNRILILTAVIIAALFLPSAGAKAQPNVPILTVDTLTYLGKTETGVASGAFFLPDGNIITMWKDTPLIIDSKSGEIIRRLDPLGGGDLRNVKLSLDGKYLIASSDIGKKVWDVLSGKIIKQLKLGEYCFSPDGTKMYCSTPNDSKDPGIIRVYDMNTLEQIDRFFNNGFVSADYISISPDGQTLAVSVYRKEIHEWDTKTNQVILIDLKNNNNYKVIEELEPSVYSMEFSPDGRHLMYRYISSDGSNVYISIYNYETLQNIHLNKSDLAKLYDIVQPAMYDPRFLSDNIILIPISSGFNFKEYSYIWDISYGGLKKIINFATNNIDIQNNSLLLSSYFGALTILDLEYVSVKGTDIPIENYLIYSNNLLEYFSDKTFLAQSIIYDTTGKVIINLGIQPIVVGNNLIRINKNLPVGVYILTIKNGTDQISKKFLVEN